MSFPARIAVLLPPPHDHQPWVWAPRFARNFSFFLLPMSTLVWAITGREGGWLGLLGGLLLICLLVLPGVVVYHGAVDGLMSGIGRMGRSDHDATVELHRHYARIHAKGATLTFDRKRLTIERDGDGWRIGNAVVAVVANDARITRAQRRRLEAWAQGEPGPLVAWW